MLHEGHFLESDVPMAGYLYNSPLRRRRFYSKLYSNPDSIFTVRCIPPGSTSTTLVFKPPFVLEGARNVFLETVKRGEYDAFGAPVNFDTKECQATVILRLYEAFGGHAQVKLLISDHLPVVKAFTTNLMEDEDEELYILRDVNMMESGCALSLSFSGFEVKTVKLVLGMLPSGQAQKRVFVQSF